MQDRAKTRRSERAIQLTRPTIEVLKAHRDRQQHDRHRIGDEWAAGDLIVTTTIGTIVNPTAVKFQLRKLVNEAGLYDADGPQVTVHTLRHMAATRMLRRGVSPAIGAEKLGHSDIGLIYRTYGHLVAADQSSANRAIEAALAENRKREPETES